MLFSLFCTPFFYLIYQSYKTKYRTKRNMIRYCFSTVYAKHIFFSASIAICIQSSHISHNRIRGYYLNSFRKYPLSLTGYSKVPESAKTLLALLVERLHRREYLVLKRINAPRSVLKPLHIKRYSALSGTKRY